MHWLSHSKNERSANNASLTYIQTPCMTLTHNHH
jgi:hypothetical protein